MTQSSDSDSVNADQVRYWNSSMGKKWVSYQQELDACFSGINARLFEYANVESGDTALDIGCGAGEITLEISDYLGPSGHVLGVDISQVLLDLAIKRARMSQRPNVNFVLADAQTYKFATGSVDLLISRFGVMFFNDPFSAFTNLADAMRSGGRMSFVCWSDVESNPWFQIPKQAAIRQLGKPQGTDPRTPGPLAFAESGYVHEILSSAGLKNIAIDKEVISLEGRGTLDEVAHLASNVGPAARIMKELHGNDDDFAAIKNEVSAEFGIYNHGHEVRVPATLNFVRCER